MSNKPKPTIKMSSQATTTQKFSKTQQHQQAQQQIQQLPPPLIITQPTGEYKIPSKEYIIKCAPHILEEISWHTEDFDLLEPDFRKTLFQRVRCRNWGTSGCGVLEAPADVETLKLIIGKGGFFLKLTTENTGIDLIWHDRVYRRFLFWGPDKNTIVNAMDRIRSRIIKYVVHVVPEKRRVEECERSVSLVNAIERLCQTPPPAPERSSPPRITRCNAVAVGKVYPYADIISDDDEEDDDMRSTSICVNKKYDIRNFRTSSMMYPTKDDDVSNYEDECRMCPGDIPGRKEYYEACSVDDY